MVQEKENVVKDVVEEAAIEELKSVEKENKAHKKAAQPKPKKTTLKGNVSFIKNGKMLVNFKDGSRWVDAVGGLGIGDAYTVEL